MIKIAGISLITLVLVIVLKNTKREFAFILTLCSSILLFGIVVNDFVNVINKIYLISGEIAGLEPYISLMVKILGVTLITQFVVDLCRDSGENALDQITGLIGDEENALASQTEITSKIIILIMIMPLFEAVINTVSGLLK